MHSNRIRHSLIVSALNDSFFVYLQLLHRLLGMQRVFLPSLHILAKDTRSINTDNTVEPGTFRGSVSQNRVHGHSELYIVRIRVMLVWQTLHSILPDRVI